MKLIHGPPGGGDNGLKLYRRPERWPEYAERMASLISRGGKLVGLFLYGEEPEPPPFPLTKEMASSLFEKNFCLVQDTPVRVTVPVYQGLEHWQEWERI